MPEEPINLVNIIGTFASFYLIVTFAYKLFNNIGTFYFSLGYVNFKNYGNWAVITNCTDGIGQAYTKQLAEKGLNIVLISSCLANLKPLSDHIKLTYLVETLVIAADPSGPRDIYDHIETELASLDIAVLVNNVGMVGNFPLEYVASVDRLNEIDELVSNRCVSMSKMTWLVLPGMEKRKRGIIINILSAAGRQPIPLMALRCATEAYVDFLSRAISIEYCCKGVISQSVCPLHVVDGEERESVAFFSPDTESFVRAALRTVGSQTVTNGCLGHNIQVGLLGTRKLEIKI